MQLRQFWIACSFLLLALQQPEYRLVAHIPAEAYYLTTDNLGNAYVMTNGHDLNKYKADGTRIRSYVLVALPIGSANLMKSAKETARSSKEAFQELDEITGNSPAKTEPAKPGESVSVVNPDGSSSSVQLLPVENEEYKQRRAEALKKPGAVIGQVTVR